MDINIKGKLLGMSTSADSISLSVEATEGSQPVVMIDQQQVTGTINGQPAHMAAQAVASASSTTEALPLWANIDPKFAERVKAGAYPDHGPAVSRNAKGQPVDAQGRVAGPLPTPAVYESEIENAMRLGIKHYDGEPTYDGWGNRLSDLSAMVQLDAEYNTADDLFAVAERDSFPRRLFYTAKDGTKRSRLKDLNGPLSGPDSHYVENEFGRVSRVD
jgi:hypothetical protein